MSKHTQGPWTLDGGAILAHNRFGDEVVIADMFPGSEYSGRKGDTADGAELSNARLIAAAPDLLAACEAVYETFGLRRTLPIGFPIEIADMLQQAIRKAKGGK